MKEELVASVYALVPSRGLGGGIESYVRASLEALEANGAQVIEMPLQTPEQPLSLRRKAEFAFDVIRRTPANSQARPHRHHRIPSVVRPCRVYRAPCGRIANAWVRRVPRTRSFPGSSQASERSHAGGREHVHGGHVGAVRERRRTSCWHPSRSLRAPHSRSADRAEPGDERRVMSVFQLSSFVGKGGPCIIDACERLRASGRPITLTFAGHGHAAPELTAAAAGRDWIRVHESPTDSDLDALFREVDLFVLATRSRYREGVRGEGLGLVLVEASLAGLPIVAPAYGGSADAFIEGLTGLKPSDESAEALGLTIAWAFDHPEETTKMAAGARVWASAAFGPEGHAASAAELFLGGAPRPDFWGLEIQPIRS